MVKKLLNSLIWFRWGVNYWVARLTYIAGCAIGLFCPLLLGRLPNYWEWIILLSITYFLGFWTEMFFSSSSGKSADRSTINMIQNAFLQGICLGLVCGFFAAIMATLSARFG